MNPASIQRRVELQRGRMRAATDASLCGAPAARWGWLTEHARGAPAQRLPLFLRTSPAERAAVCFSSCPVLPGYCIPPPNVASFLDEVGRSFGAMPACVRPLRFPASFRFAPVRRDFPLPFAFRPKVLAGAGDGERSARTLLRAIRFAESSRVSVDTRPEPPRSSQPCGSAFCCLLRAGFG